MINWSYKSCVNLRSLEERVVIIKRYHMSLFSLLIFLPVFLSIGLEGNIEFDRIAGYDHRSWIITIPISVVLSFFIIIGKIHKVTIPKSSIFILFYLFFCVLIIFFSSDNGVDLSTIKVIILMATFVYILHSFKHYFNEKLNAISTQEDVENKYVLYPLTFILLTVILSHLLVGISPENNSGMRSEFLTTFFNIYNYEQYFAFIFVPLLASANRLKFIYFFILFLMVMYLADATVNRTASIVTLCMFAYYLIDKVAQRNWRNLIYKVTKVLLVIFPIFYLLIMFLFIDPDDLPSNLSTRYYYIQSYFLNLQWYQIILPIPHYTGSITPDMHNEMLEVFDATSLLGILLYYFA